LRLSLPFEAVSIVASRRTSGLSPEEGLGRIEMTYGALLVGGVALSAVALAAMPASAKELKTIGMSVGSMSNPYFIALAEGATNAAKKINPDAKLTVVSSEYDLGKQFSQMDNFIAAGVDLILVAADDPHAIAPAVKRAQDAGIPVIAVDVEAEGANATMETDNYQAGLVSCAYLGEKMGGAGDVVMQWVGPLSGSRASRVAMTRLANIQTSRWYPTTKTAVAPVKAA
jgi:ABC-type sugar transport system substrate-binding protein